jgi:hypothetical protein
MIRIGLGVGLLLLAGAAQANDPVAFQAIAASDLRTAESVLANEVAAGTREPGVLINLAHVYSRTGRTQQSVDLYRQVMALPNAQMARQDGSPAWSHDLAMRGIQRLTRVASR